VGFREASLLRRFPTNKSPSTDAPTKPNKNPLAAEITSNEEGGRDRIWQLVCFLQAALTMLGAQQSRRSLPKT
jgi:hypothetical protein